MDPNHPTPYKRVPQIRSRWHHLTNFMAHPNCKAHSALLPQGPLEVSKRVSHAHIKPNPILQAWSLHWNLLPEKYTYRDSYSTAPAARVHAKDVVSRASSTIGAHTTEVLLCLHSKGENTTFPSFISWSKVPLRRQTSLFANSGSPIHQGFVPGLSCRTDTTESFLYPHLSSPSDRLSTQGSRGCLQVL